MLFAIDIPVTSTDLYISSINNLETFVFEKSKYIIDTKYTFIKDLKIGDIINVEYLPFSQRNIDYYNNEKIIGKVFHIVDGDILVYYDDEKLGIRNIKSIIRTYCGYYDERGYDIVIKKYNHINL